MRHILRQARDKRGLSQKQLAKRLRERGMHTKHQQISKWESGDGMHLYTFCELCDELGIDIKLDIK